MPRDIAMSRQAGVPNQGSGNVEKLDDRIRQAREIVERGNNWLMDREVSFIDRYKSGELHIVIRRSLPEESHYGFLIFNDHKATSHWREIITQSPASYGKSGGSGSDRQQFSMLTHDVELMENPKRGISSSIRLQRFDNRAFGCGECLYEFSSLKVATQKVIFALRDRKIGLVRLSYAVAVGERGGEDIEATSDGVDMTANLNVECSRQRFFLSRYYDVIRRVRIRVFDFQIHVEVKPGIDPLIEGWELGYGPIDTGF